MLITEFLLTLSPHQSLSFIAGPLNCIQCLHRTDICKSLPAQLYEDIDKRRLLFEFALTSNPCRVQGVLFVLLEWFVRWKVSGCTAVVSCVLFPGFA